MGTVIDRKTTKFNMKVLILCAAIVAVAVGEMCGSDRDCKVTACANDVSGGQVRCILRECTCVTTHLSGHKCSGVSDCSCNSHTFLTKPHCVDGICHCSRH